MPVPEQVMFDGKAGGAGGEVGGGGGRGLGGGGLGDGGGGLGGGFAEVEVTFQQMHPHVSEGSLESEAPQSVGES